MVSYFGYSMVQSAIISGQKIPDPPNWKSNNSKMWIEKEGENYKVAYVIDGKRGWYYVGDSKVSLDAYVGREVANTR